MRVTTKTIPPDPERCESVTWTKDGETGAWYEKRCNNIARGYATHPQLKRKYRLCLAHCNAPAYRKFKVTKYADHTV